MNDLGLGLGLALDSYLAVRRALGFKLDRAEYLLRKFVKYMQQKQSSIVTIALALDWATQSNNAAPITHARHLNTVRGFARYLNASDPRHQIPPAKLIPYRKIRYEPYIYSDEDVTALLGAAREIPHPLMAATHTTLFGLLAATGMRLGEALRLDVDDVDDLRHSFAVNTIRRWYEDGLDVEPRLPSLSTYLGHVSPTSTYWYMTATPELMALAAKRLERAMEKLP